MEVIIAGAGSIGLLLGSFLIGSWDGSDDFTSEGKSKQNLFEQKEFSASIRMIQKTYSVSMRQRIYGI